jgi:hypothetical protein
MENFRKKNQTEILEMKISLISVSIRRSNLRSWALKKEMRCKAKEYIISIYLY